MPLFKTLSSGLSILLTLAGAAVRSNQALNPPRRRSRPAASMAISKCFAERDRPKTSNSRRTAST